MVLCRKAGSNDVTIKIKTSHMNEFLNSSPGPVTGPETEPYQSSNSNQYSQSVTRVT